MSIKQCCCLCYTSCYEFKLLQNEVGDSTEIYDITVKYFDPMLLASERNAKDDKQVNVLCHDCWLHIKDFHEFQQTVIMTRYSLEKCDTIRQIEIEVKEETTKTITADGLDNFSVDYNYEYNNDIDYEPSPLHKSFSSFEDEDDEKPLITLRNTTKDLSKNVDNEVSEKANLDNSENIDNKVNGKPNSVDTENQFEAAKPKLRRGRKPKAAKLPIKKKKLKLEEACKKYISNYTEKGMESDNFIAEWKPQLECDICSETSESFQNLRQHFKEKHKTRGYIKCCERKFYRRYVLVDHIRLHLNPDMFKCDICGKPSSSQYNLKLHKKIMHENTEQYECEVCHKMFNQKPTLERHMLTHVTGSKDFVCQECGKAYVLEVQLKSHIKTVHNVDRVCDQCGKTIHGVAALKKHLMEHAGVKRPKFPCEQCNTELNSRNSLRRHMAAFHHDGSTIYVCGICGKVASSENALLTHKKHVHEEIRKHKCTYCDKAFKRPKVLREHIATHTGQDLYQCPHCPQTFKVSANMHHHRKKIHPVEWEEGRKNRLQLPKVNINQVKNQVVI